MAFKKKQVDALIALRKNAKVVPAKSINDIFLEMEQNTELKKTLWEIWQASRGAVPYQSSGFMSARLSYTVKWMHEKFPQFSKAAYYKYLDRNIN